MKPSPWLVSLPSSERTILEHPNPDRYAGQRIFVVRREEYVYLVPFVEDEQSDDENGR